MFLFIIRVWQRHLLTKRATKYFIRGQNDFLLGHVQPRDHV